MAIGFMPALHGLRAIAAIAVLLFHWCQLFPGFNIWIAQLHVPGHPWVNPSLPWSMGWQGVSLFFVLSGYLLTAHWLDRDMTFQALAHFYKRRIVRIYPAAWLQLIVLIVLAAIWPALFEQATWLKWLLNAVLWVNLPPWFEAPLNGVWWTLPVELMFYLVLPLLVFCQKRFGLGVVVVAVLSVTVAWRWWVMLSYVDQNLSTVLPVLDALPGVLMTFGAGFAAAIVQGQIKKTHAMPLLWASMLLFIALQTLLVSFIEVYWQGGWLLCLWNSLLALSMAGIVMALCKLPESLATKALSTRPMIALGDWSFGIYLWHFPVLQLLHRLSPDWGSTAFNSLLALGITLVLTLALGALSFTQLERPLMRLKFA